MWKPSLTLPVLEAPAKKRSFLGDSGQAMPFHPRESARKSAGWALSKKGVTGNRAHASRENQREWLAPLGLWAVLPSLVITRVRPWQHLRETLAAVHLCHSPAPPAVQGEEGVQLQSGMAESAACISATARLLSGGLRSCLLGFHTRLRLFEHRGCIFSSSDIFHSDWHWCGHWRWFLQVDGMLTGAVAKHWKERCFGF